MEGIYLVGGTCCLAGIEDIIEKRTGIPTYKQDNPMFVTPLGIARSCTQAVSYTHLMDPERHNELVGVDNELILENLKELLHRRYNVKVRMPMLKGINDSREEIDRVIQMCIRDRYYKQMGFSLEQMQSLVEGSTYQCLERSFLSKSEELQTERQELLYRYTAVKDWYELVREAELVSQRKEHDVTIKYVNSTVYCSKEQDFSYNYMESIINIPWVN